MASIGVALVAAPALGQERATHDLVWEREQGAEACPDRATFTDSIRTRVGYDPFQQGSRRQLHVRLSRVPATWRAELRVLDNGLERGSQQLEAQGADCSALFAAIVAVASVTLDEATRPPAEPAAQPSPAESTPEQTLEPPPPAVPPNTSPPIAPRERPEPPSRKQPPPVKRWAIGFELVQDQQLIEDKADVCGSGESDALQCFEQSPGSPPYAGTPQPGTNNRVTAGLLNGNPRLLGDVQYLLTPRLAAELRLGWAFGGGPKGGQGRFWPLHLETGVRFWLADQSARLRGYLGASLGIAQFDARFPLSVSDCDAAGVSLDREQCLQRQQEGVSKSLDVYQRLGKGFVSGRVGLAWRFADDHAWSIGLATAYAFPSTGIIFEPNIGYVALF